MDNDNKNIISRRRFLTLAGLSTAAAGAAMTTGAGLFTSTGAHASKAKYKLRFGASVISHSNEKHLRTGVYHFAEQIETLSKGELQIQVVDNGQACSEPTCGDRVLNGIYQIGSSSAQNLGTVLPYSIALDWPMLWGSREEYFNFLFSPESNRLYRDVMARHYGILPLFGSGEMRSIMMGKSYENADLINSPAQLKGAKIRITNSEMIAGFAEGLAMNPIPLAWTELLEGLRSGVVDATETWPGAATGFGMQNVLSQDVAVNFSPGFEMVFMSVRAYEKLPEHLQEVILEASYQAMIFGYNGVAEAQNQVVGNGPNPAAKTTYSEAGVRLSSLSEQQMQAFREAAGVTHREDLYKSVRAKLARIAGTDVLDPMRDFQASVAGKPLAPQRWWL